MHGHQRTDPTWFDPEAVVEPAAPVQYLAVCPPCGYQGKPHRSNLRALGDFDAHAASAIHAQALRGEVTPRCDICGQPDGPGEPDWNGETGNHRSCEVVPLSPFQQSLEALDA